MKKLFFSLIIFLLFTGCASREYFSPSSEKVSKPIFLNKNEVKHNIIYFTQDVATLDDYSLVPDNKKLPKGFVGIDKHLSKKGNLLRVNGENIEFDNLIVTASKKDNLLAILFGDNHFELYDLSQHKTISNLNFEQFLAVRKFVPKPFFYKDLLLIPTLNGKLIVYNLIEHKMIRSIIVSQKDYFNNIIYLGVKKDNLIVASRDNLIVIAPNMVINKEYNIKHIIVDDNNIYIFTIEGDVIKLDFNLKVEKKIEFKYANILAPMIYKNNIYFISRGDKSFLIKLDNLLNKYKIIPLKILVADKHRVSGTDEEYLYLKRKIFSKNGEFYIGDYELRIK